MLSLAQGVAANKKVAKILFIFRKDLTLLTVFMFLCYFESVVICLAYEFCNKQEINTTTLILQRFQYHFKDPENFLKKLFKT